MAGSSIYTTGPISYATGSISAGETTSLLSTFTEVSNAALVNGNKMYPLKLDYVTINDLYYTVEAGSYAGNYYINRNNIYGASAWSNALVNSGQVRLDLLQGYQHWPADNYIYPLISNKSADDHDVLIQFDSTNVYQQSLGANSANDYDPGNIILCASSPDNYTAFDPGGPNAGWTISYTITNTSQNNGSTVTVDITDYHVGDPLYYASFNLNSGTVWSFNDGYGHFFWKVPKITITMDVP